MIDGTAKNSMALLQPKTDERYPVMKAPNTPPMVFIDPIHDICSFVNGPDFRGVESCVNVAIAGETHPTIAPWPNDNRFANKMKNSNHNHSTAKYIIQFPYFLPAAAAMY